MGLRLAEAFKSPEHSDCMFTMISTGGTEFIEDEGFLLKRSFLVTEKDCFNVFPLFDRRLIIGAPFPGKYPVTSIMSQRSLLTQTLGNI